MGAVVKSVNDWSNVPQQSGIAKHDGVEPITSIVINASQCFEIQALPPRRTLALKNFFIVQTEERNVVEDRIDKVIDEARAIQKTKEFLGILFLSSGCAETCTNYIVRKGKHKHPSFECSLATGRY